MKLKIPLQNIFNDGRIIYLFNRYDDDLKVIREPTFFPYCYQKSHGGLFRGYFGEKYNRVFVRTPYEIKNIRNNESGEADIPYCRRFLIDKVDIEKSRTKWCVYDIETKSKFMPNPEVASDAIICITAYNNYDKKYVTFWYKDYKSEYELITAFVNYLRKIKADIHIGYNIKNFDFPYLVNRYPNFSVKISPISKANKRNNYPAGVSIVDYYELIKKVYRYKKYTLDYIYCTEFKKELDKTKYDFYEANEVIKEKNIKDVKKLVLLEEKLKLIDYFDEIRRIATVTWDDITSYSILIDTLILKQAKQMGFVLPSKPDDEEKLRRIEEDEITGGYVYAEPGLHENVHLFDVGGTYPNLIVTFNLDPANKRNIKNNQTITVRKVHILQNPNAIIPTIANKLINSRKEIQKQLETAQGEEYELVKKKDEAHKSLNNTLYGVLLFKSSRLYDKDIASSITYLARFLIRYIKWSLRKMGLDVVASDTDSVFSKSTLAPETIENEINNKLIPRWLAHFGKESGTVKFKYEGTFKNLFILTKKHYIGTLIKPNGEIKLVRKGIEALRSDSSIFQEKFQEELFVKILNKESKEAIIQFIKSQIEAIKTLPLIEIAFPCKLSKPIESYKSDSIHLRALRYAQEENPNWKVNVGQNYYYCFIVPKKEEIKKVIRHIKKEDTIEEKEVEIKRPMNVIAFDEHNGIGNNEIDYSEMVRRNIMDKVEKIFCALEWDISEILNKKEIKIDSNCAGEVSKETCGTSSSESGVRAASPAPIIVSVPKASNYNSNFDLNELELKEIDYAVAKEFIKKNHYSHTIPSSIKVSLGFYYKNELKTAIIYGCPVGRNVTKWLQVEHDSCLELVRLFSVDGLPKNTESYCIGQSFKFLKQNYPNYKYLISYADPNHGHCGYIYQATNWKYVGVQRKLLKERRIFIDGKEVHTRILNVKHGTTSTSKLKEIYGNRLQILGAMKKHVYLMCLGNRKECREWYSKFKFLPYPKAKNDIIEGKAQ